MTTPSDLIEEVAKAMLRTLGWTNPQIEYARKHRSSAWLDTMSQSRAAASVIIEACVKVADAHAVEIGRIAKSHVVGGWYRDLASLSHEQHGATKVAQLIRALAAKPEGA